MKETLDIQNPGDTLQFIRGCRPANAAKWPHIATSAVLYVVWLVFKDRSRGQDTLSIGDPEDQDYLPHIHEFVSHIVSAKARVTPLQLGLTIPQSEMSVLVLATRLQYKVTKVLPESVATVSTIGDSTCIISATRTSACYARLVLAPDLAGG